MATTDHLDEQWDLYDRQFAIVGRQRRGDPVPAGRYHLTVAVLIFTGANKVLLQRRSATKLNQPETWDVAAGGSALRGETAAQAAARELSEELGLAADFSTASPVATTWHASWVEVVYRLMCPGLTLDQLTLQKAEVSRVVLVSAAKAGQLLHGQSTDWSRVIQAALA